MTHATPYDVFVDIFLYVIDWCILIELMDRMYGKIARNRRLAVLTSFQRHFFHAAIFPICHCCLYKQLFSCPLKLSYAGILSKKHTQKTAVFLMPAQSDLFLSVHAERYHQYAALPVSLGHDLSDYISSGIMGNFISLPPPVQLGAGRHPPLPLGNFIFDSPVHVDCHAHSSDISQL